MSPRVVPSCISLRWTIVGLAALLASAVGTGTAAIHPASAASAPPSPCTLLTKAEVQAVIPGPLRNPMIMSNPLLSPPNGTECDRISTVAAHRHRSAIFGVSVQLWDFRAQGPVWIARWGTRAADYVRSICRRPPTLPGLRLPVVHQVSRLGDYACGLEDTVIQMAKGPFFLRVSLGAGTQNRQTRAVVTRLARKAIGRLRA